MKKFKELRLTYQAVRIYILSLVIAIIFYYPFDKLYIIIFKPIIIGESLFLPIPNLIATIINGTLFAFYLFFPFFTFWLITKKQWLIWGIGIILPILIALTAGTKDFFWAILLSFIGWFLAQIILRIRKIKN